MAGNRFYGPVGYGVSREEPAGGGVWKKTIREVKLRGEVVRNTRRLDDSDKVNNNVSVGTTISVVAHESLHGDLFAALYILWKGIYWVIEDVQVLPDQPRLLMRLGGVYDGKTAEVAGASEGSSGS